MKTQSIAEKDIKFPIGTKFVDWDFELTPEEIEIEKMEFTYMPNS